jgi:hypothetical protein
MKSFRQVFLVIAIALASIGLILGSFSLSLTEGGIAASQTPTQTLTPTHSPTLLPFSSAVDSPTPSPSLNPTFTLTFTWTASLLPSPTNCPLPLGWLSYSIQSGDTLVSLATHYRISVAELQQANCLESEGVLPGVSIYVPLLPTQSPVQCGRPAGWIIFLVQPGDTLYRLSAAYGISVDELQRANCMGNSTLLHAWQNLYVPPWAAHTPSQTLPAVATATPSLTNTPAISLPTDTPTEASTNVPTEPPAPTPTDTPIEIPTDTLTSTGP